MFTGRILAPIYTLARGEHDSVMDVVREVETAASQLERQLLEVTVFLSVGLAQGNDEHIRKAVEILENLQK